jgi:hypothetical protein
MTKKQNLIYNAGCIFRIMIVVELIKRFSAFMEFECVLLYSRELTIGSYIEPVESGLHPALHFFEVPPPSSDLFIGREDVCLPPNYQVIADCMVLHPRKQYFLF